ncbi:GAF domain-containing protein [Falsiroseomonas selenitidurans]|uniref:GAF domain-containing protein n=1 Tax=Falsiroseomonas selenitidurans TaxID=2716335 RepID=A0ABX1E953_9PROT|nr:GAF domain-containing protein [Falsiroseomonas selenitidurans]NKC33764.1 GAF domain-containing protein [Falsiroseomonas selenitidurans]
MASIRAHIWNGRPAPCEHDDLPIARIGTVQPHGVMMVVVPETGLVEHVSANVEEILGVPAPAVLGHAPTVAFRDAESLARIAEILRPGRRYFDNPTPLVANGRRFEAICHLRQGRLFLEIEPYVDAAHDYQTMVATALDAIARQTTVQGLYEAAARMMNFVTQYDRVKLYRFLAHGHGVVVGEFHAPDSKLPASFLGYHFAASDVPEAAKEILRTGKTRQKPTQRGSVPLLTLGAGGEAVPSGDAVDMTDCWLRGIHPCDNGYNRNLGVGSNIIFPVCIDNTVWGLFVVHNRDEKFLNYDSRVVIEQLSMMFASRLIELEAVEARIAERQRLSQAMVATVEGSQTMLAAMAAMRGEPVGSARLHAMHAVSRHVAALAPTYVSINGVEVATAGRAEDRFASELLRLADADGAAVIRSGPAGHVHLVGSTPDALTVRGIAAMFGNRLPPLDSSEWRVFATDALGDFAPIGPDLRALASGVLAAPIGSRGDMILWFRRERVVDATWAGRPPSTAELNSEMMFRPRADFAAHRAPLAGAARAWLDQEVLLAAQFASAIGDVWQRAQRGVATATPATELPGDPVVVDQRADADHPVSRTAGSLAVALPSAAASRWNSVA